MNGQVNNAEYDFLWKLLANPADPNHSYIFSLQSLVSDFPQSGALRALLMPNGDKRHVKHAAAYFTPMLLHKLATAPDSLPRVSNEQIVFSDDLPRVSSDIHYNILQAEPFVPPVPQPEAEYLPVVDDEDAVIEDEANAAEVQYNYIDADAIVDQSHENIPAYIDEAVQAEEATAAFHQVPQQAPVEEPVPAPSVTSEDLAKEYEQYMAKTEITPTESVSSYEEDEIRYFHQPIDDEVYDEIVSIEDIGLEQLAILNKSAQESADGGDNYFVFEPEIAEDAGKKQEQASQPVSDTQQTPPQPTNQPVPVLSGSNFGGGDTKDHVSKYNDEKMPYSFMWWLDKTRKEHAYIYQPYVSNKVPAAAPKQNADEKPVLDELQKQYYQNIVSNTSLTGLYNDPLKMSGNQSSVRKEDKIIERFIQEEPHIKHPTDMKLDNENKAKRSSEDKEELVTETLARIYTEQMLYHKAIITYKKLMLKYPEKSLYFAGQIDQLENKIN
ncbi:hypothetical protein [Mucilaginibacter panaciglaebae]|uniref:Tetratricopeptide repeat protein n=1 Tax=Mucilaginibacter panaciglaebae TaxID=502331 RepID=A0ABP7WVZ4_9SPHI